MSTLEVNSIQPLSSGTTVTLGASGKTFNIPSGCTISNSGTATGFGKLLQGVTNTYSGGQITTTSSAMTDAISLAITPSATSSKVLVLLTFNYHFNANTYGVGGRILRGSTTIMTDSVDNTDYYYHTYHNDGNDMYGKANYHILDAPSTTSATTYKYQFGSYRNGYESRFAQQGGQTASTATLTLLELAG